MKIIERFCYFGAVALSSSSFFLYFLSAIIGTIPRSSNITVIIMPAIIIVKEWTEDGRREDEVDDNDEF